MTRTALLRKTELRSRSRPRPTTAERFWRKVIQGPDDGCWEWTGTIGLGGRYGAFYLEGRMRPAHRIAWEMTNGPIPNGLEIDHLCRNTHCVNPAHLEAVTHAENMRRGNGWAGENARKTHCEKHGVELVQGPRERICRECAKDRNRRYRYRKSHKDPVVPELYFYVLARDGGCIGPRVGMERACFGRLELDHLVNGGVGKRGPSTARNLSTLCGQHHYLKTVEARKWRPAIAAYLERVEGESVW